MKEEKCWRPSPILISRSVFRRKKRAMFGDVDVGGSAANQLPHVNHLTTSTSSHGLSIVTMSHIARTICQQARL